MKQKLAFHVVQHTSAEKSHTRKLFFPFASPRALLQNQASGFLQMEATGIMLHIFRLMMTNSTSTLRNARQSPWIFGHESVPICFSFVEQDQELMQRRQAHRRNLGSVYSSKRAGPSLGDQWAGDDRGPGPIATATYDLVQQMQYLYVSVAKARNLQPCDPYVEVRLGNYRGTTRHFDRKPNPEWNQVFAFSKSSMQSSALEVYVKDKETVGRDEYVGRVVFDLNEIPTRAPPDSPLAPQWYRLLDRRGDGKARGEVMLAVWMGTQADEAFPEAWHSDAASVVNDEGAVNIRSKVYVSPKLWYLRVNIIEAQDIQPGSGSRNRQQRPELFVKAQIGNQIHKTRACAPAANANPFWNEVFVFVSAEPFEDYLVLTVEDRVSQMKDEVLGKLALPLTVFEKRLDHKPAVNSRWFDLENLGIGLLDGETRREMRFSSRIHLRVCLEGAYHVMDESTVYISDTQPTARQLWKTPVGILELGILGAEKLAPMKIRDHRDSRGTTDAYCVARYGQKWVRTRTIIGSSSPNWNEQYTWEVFDPCTVITVAVFDNCNLSGSTGRDSRIGKIRIRLSALETGKPYTKSYPLVVLQPSATVVRRVGELRLALRFTCLSLANIVHLYSEPLLPKMHYVYPLSMSEISSLRHQATSIVAARLGRAEPPLRREVIEYMLDVDSQMWSMRRSKANFFRVMALLSGAIGACGWLREVCRWSNPVTTVLVHVLFLILVRSPELTLPTVFMYMVVIGVWKYRGRPRGPSEVDVRLSWAEAASPDELDEEVDTFPTTRSPELVRMRYDRLRTVAGRVQTVVGDVATQGERVHGLLSWRDPRATGLFVGLCLVGAVVLYVVPFRVVVMAAGLYKMRHPRFRSRMPAVPSNFFRRLPSKIDDML